MWWKARKPREEHEKQPREQPIDPEGARGFGGKAPKVFRLIAEHPNHPRGTAHEPVGRKKSSAARAVKGKAA